MYMYRHNKCSQPFSQHVKNSVQCRIQVFSIFEILFIFMLYLVNGKQYITNINTCTTNTIIIKGASFVFKFSKSLYFFLSILAIRLAKMQSHIWPNIFCLSCQVTYLWKFPGRPCDSTHGIVLFDGNCFSNGVWWETKQENFHGLSGFYSHGSG